MTGNGLFGELVAWTGLGEATPGSTTPVLPAGVALAEPDGDGDRSQVGAILDVCDRVIGESSRRSHVFDWLQSAGSDDWLAVDAYYPKSRLVVLCQDQPQPHDYLCAEQLPAHGLQLFTVKLEDFRRDSARSFSRLIGDLRLTGAAPPTKPSGAGTAPPAKAIGADTAPAARAPEPAPAPAPRLLVPAPRPIPSTLRPIVAPPEPAPAPPPPARAAPRPFVPAPVPISAALQSYLGAPQTAEPAPEATQPARTLAEPFIPAPYPLPRAPRPPVPVPEFVIKLPEPEPEAKRFRVGQMQAEAAARASRVVAPRVAGKLDRAGSQPRADPAASLPSMPSSLSPTGAAVLKAAEAYGATPFPAPAVEKSPAARARAAAISRALARGLALREPDPQPVRAEADVNSDELGLGAVLVLILFAEVFGGVVACALAGGYLVLAFGLALDACARMLGTVAAARSGKDWGAGWPWACALIGSPAVATFAFYEDGSLMMTDSAPLAGPIAVFAIVCLVIGLAGIPVGI